MPDGSAPSWEQPRAELIGFRLLMKTRLLLNQYGPARRGYRRWGFPEGRVWQPGRDGGLSAGKNGPEMLQFLFQFCRALDRLSDLLP